MTTPSARGNGYLLPADRWKTAGGNQVPALGNLLPSNHISNPVHTLLPNMSLIKPVTFHDDPAHFRKVSRREFLYAGLIGGLGLTMGDYMKLRAAETDIIQPTAKSLIHIFLPGGCAHQETWDPKPLAPIEYRGPLGTVDTKIPGVKFSQYLQNTAKIADKITVVRSMTHGEAAHERGTHNMFTGYRPSPALAFPSMGSVVSHELGSRNNLPPMSAFR